MSSGTATAISLAVSPRRPGSLRVAVPGRAAPGPGSSGGPRAGSDRSSLCPGSLGHGQPGWARAGAVPRGWRCWGSRDAVRALAARWPPPLHHRAPLGDAAPPPPCRQPQDGVNPRTKPGGSCEGFAQGVQGAAQSAGSSAAAALTRTRSRGVGEHGAATAGQDRGTSVSSPHPLVLPVVTGYTSAVQCPLVLPGCSAAEAAQGTVCEQTSVSH